MRSKLTFGIAFLGCLLSVWLLTLWYKQMLQAYERNTMISMTEYAWFFRLLLNLAGYLTVLMPIFIVYKYLERTKYFETITNPTCLYRSLYACFGEAGERLDAKPPGAVREATSAKHEALELAFCFTGLMAAYLVWGLLQEKIMTQIYTLPDGTTVKFNDSQFVVFINRLLALLIAGARLACTRQTSTAPLYKYSYCSLTNVISAWCQYEALKFVSFPTQVLSKSCKVIPVMLMGALVSGNKYELYEYVTATMISAGMVLFMFGSHDDYSASTATTVSGLLLLALYMACDSFTSSWQGALFTRYRVRPLQMVCGVNAYSCLLTAAALVHQPATKHSLQLLQSSMFASDVALLSVSSALGQLLIYRTISRFGAVVFTIIMTLRQAVSILLSCIVFGHRVSAGGVAGVVLVFAAALLRVYCRHRTRGRARNVRADKV